MCNLTRMMLLGVALAHLDCGIASAQQATPAPFSGRPPRGDGRETPDAEDEDAPGHGRSPLPPRGPGLGIADEADSAEQQSSDPRRPLPADLGARYRSLRSALPGITVLGGCCGTDHHRVRAICEACLPD
jgi:hypothetical protein